MCQLNGRLSLVVEDLWTLSDTCSASGGEGVAYTDVHDLHSGGGSSAVRVKGSNVCLSVAERVCLLGAWTYFLPW